MDTPLTKIEFIGGPDGGRSIGISAFKELVGDCSPDDSNSLAPPAVLPPAYISQPLSAEQVGRYLAKQIEGETLQYVGDGETAQNGENQHPVT